MKRKYALVLVRMAKSLALAIILILVASSLLFIESTIAQFDRITTYCDIFVDDIVEGQPVVATIQMSPPTPTGEGYKVTMWVTPPNPKDYVAGEPWLKLVVLTDSNGRATVTFNVPTYSGKWYVDVMFGSSNYANHTILYLAGNWQTQFTVSPAKTPTPSSTVTPTPNPTPTPSVPEVSWLMILPLFIITLSIAVLVRFRRVGK